MTNVLVDEVGGKPLRAKRFRRWSVVGTELDEREIERVLARSNVVRGAGIVHTRDDGGGHAVLELKDARTAETVRHYFSVPVQVVAINNCRGSKYGFLRMVTYLLHLGPKERAARKSSYTLEELLISPGWVTCFEELSPFIEEQLRAREHAISLKGEIERQLSAGELQPYEAYERYPDLWRAESGRWKRLYDQGCEMRKDIYRAQREEERNRLVDQLIHQVQTGELTLEEVQKGYGILVCMDVRKRLDAA